MLLETTPRANRYPELSDRMHDLPQSIFATPGVRAFGSLGVVPEGEEYAGLTRGKYCTTPWKEPLFPNTFVFATTKNRKLGGGAAVRRPFFVTDILYDSNYPDRVGVQGRWLCEGDEILLYHDVKRMKKQVKKELEGMKPGVYLVDKTFADILSITQIETSIVLKVADTETDDTKSDVLSLKGIFSIANWQHMITTLNAGSSVTEIVSLLDLPAIHRVFSRSNLMPLEPSFEPVEDDVFRMGDHVYLIGARAGCVTHGIEFMDQRDGRMHCGRLEGRPSNGVLVMTRLVAPNEAGSALEPLDREMLFVLGNKELVLTEELLAVPLTCMKDVAPILAVPPRALALFELEYEAATRPMGMMVVEGTIKVISEPTTEEDVRAQLLGITSALAFESRADTQHLLFNEAQLQAVPERQADLSLALIVLRGFSLSRALTVMRNAEWRGDRALTLEEYLTPETLRDVLGEHPSDGWIIPEKEPDAKGVVRKRVKNKGYLLIMMHADVDGRGSNVISYCLETKRLTLRLALGYFGENLKFVKGARPPPKGEGEGPDHEFDIVSRTYQQLTTAEVWTEARALAHFRGQH